LVLPDKKEFFEKYKNIFVITAKFLAAVLVALFCIFVQNEFFDDGDSEYTFFNGSSDEESGKKLPMLGLAGAVIDENQPMDIRIPRCEGFHLSLAEKKCDFSFTNPDTNKCYLRVTITRHDTNETVFTSSLISPGKTLENITLSTKFSYFTNYDIMIKVDAYSLDGLSFLNGLVMDAVIYTY
jgi:hypothetical protein